MPKPKLGDVVLVEVKPMTNNGSDVAFAHITRVNDADESEDVRLNARVVLDTGVDKRMTNIKLFDSRPVGDDAEKDQAEGGYNIAWRLGK